MSVFRFIAVVGVLLLAASNALARPQFIVLDVADPMNRPEDLGIHVTAKRVGADINFKVELNQAAATAISTASVFFDAPDRGRPKFTVSTTKTPEGTKRFTFKIPERYVKPYTTDYFPNRPMTVSSALHLRSKALRKQDRIVNFIAYRMRLDNVPTE